MPSPPCPLPPPTGASVSSPPLSLVFPFLPPPFARGSPPMAPHGVASTATPSAGGYAATTNGHGGTAMAGALTAAPAAAPAEASATPPSAVPSAPTRRKRKRVWGGAAASTAAAGATKPHTVLGSRGDNGAARGASPREDRPPPPASSDIVDLTTPTPPASPTGGVSGSEHRRGSGRGVEDGDKLVTAMPPGIVKSTLVMAQTAAARAPSEWGGEYGAGAASTAAYTSPVTPDLGGPSSARDPDGGPGRAGESAGASSGRHGQRRTYQPNARALSPVFDGFDVASRSRSSSPLPGQAQAPSQRTESTDSAFASSPLQDKSQLVHGPGNEESSAAADDKDDESWQGPSGAVDAAASEQASPPRRSRRSATKAKTKSDAAAAVSTPRRTTRSAAKAKAKSRAVAVASEPVCLDLCTPSPPNELSEAPDVVPLLSDSEDVSLAGGGTAVGDRSPSPPVEADASRRRHGLRGTVSAAAPDLAARLATALPSSAGPVVDGGAATEEIEPQRAAISGRRRAQSPPIGRSEPPVVIRSRRRWHDVAGDMSVPTPRSASMSPTDGPAVNDAAIAVEIEAQTVAAAGERLAESVPVVRSVLPVRTGPRRRRDDVAGNASIATTSSASPPATGMPAVNDAAAAVEMDIEPETAVSAGERDVESARVAHAVPPLGIRRRRRGHIVGGAAHSSTPLSGSPPTTDGHAVNDSAAAVDIGSHTVAITGERPAESAPVAPTALSVKIRLTPGIHDVDRDAPVATPPGSQPGGRAADEAVAVEAVELGLTTTAAAEVPPVPSPMTFSAEPRTGRLAVAPAVEQPETILPEAAETELQAPLIIQLDLSAEPLRSGPTAEPAVQLLPMPPAPDDPPEPLPMLFAAPWAVQPDSSDPALGAREIVAPVLPAYTAADANGSFTDVPVAGDAGDTDNAGDADIAGDAGSAAVALPGVVDPFTPAEVSAAVEVQGVLRGPSIPVWEPCIEEQHAVWFIVPNDLSTEEIHSAGGLSPGSYQYTLDRTEATLPSDVTAAAAAAGARTAATMAEYERALAAAASARAAVAARASAPRASGTSDAHTTAAGAQAAAGAPGAPTPAAASGATAAAGALGSQAVSPPSGAAAPLSLPVPLNVEVEQRTARPAPPSSMSARPDTDAATGSSGTRRSAPTVAASRRPPTTASTGRGAVSFGPRGPRPPLAEMQASLAARLARDAAAFSGVHYGGATAAMPSARPAREAVAPPRMRSVNVFSPDEAPASPAEVHHDSTVSREDGAPALSADLHRSNVAVPEDEPVPGSRLDGSSPVTVASPSRDQSPCSEQESDCAPGSSTSCASSAEGEASDVDEMYDSTWHSAFLHKDLPGDLDFEPLPTAVQCRETYDCDVDGGLGMWVHAQRVHALVCVREAAQAAVDALAPPPRRGASASATRLAPTARAPRTRAVAEAADQATASPTSSSSSVPWEMAHVPSVPRLPVTKQARRSRPRASLSSRSPSRSSSRSSSRFRSPSRSRRRSRRRSYPSSKRRTSSRRRSRSPRRSQRQSSSRSASSSPSPHRSRRRSRSRSQSRFRVPRGRSPRRRRSPSRSRRRSPSRSSGRSRSRSPRRSPSRSPGPSRSRSRRRSPSPRKRHHSSSREYDRGREREHSRDDRRDRNDGGRRRDRESDRLRYRSDGAHRFRRRSGGEDGGRSRSPGTLRRSLSPHSGGGGTRRGVPWLPPVAPPSDAAEGEWVWQPKTGGAPPPPLSKPGWTIRGGGGAYGGRDARAMR